MHIAYLVHDLADAAVHRRAAMLKRGGADVYLGGFRRRPHHGQAELRTPVELGRTGDAKLGARAAAVAASAARIGRLAPAVEGAEVILARNLEMLAIAVRAQRRFVPHARIVYECLDIHRLLLSKGLPGIMLRELETRLWHHTNAILTSSPAFVREYFTPRGFQGEILVVENKVFAASSAARAVACDKQPGPPWRIGYFGMLRCRRSLDVLKRLAAAMKGKVHVELRGVPSPAIFPDFRQEIGDAPHVSFLGPYEGIEALAHAYRQVQFAWTIDYYEAGQNSAWLLPNRLYESIYFGAVPLALKTVETGRWLQERSAGLLVGEDMEQELSAFFSVLTLDKYLGFAQAMDGIGLKSIAFDERDCKDLVEILRRPQGSFAFNAAAAA
jgi:hypothetical protein